MPADMRKLGGDGLNHLPPVGSQSSRIGRKAVDMQHFAWFDLSNRSLDLAENGPIEFHLVLGDMDDHQPETESLEFVLVFKSTVNRHQNVEPILKQPNQMVILEPVPAQICSRFNFMSGKAFDNSGINTGIN